MQASLACGLSKRGVYSHAINHQQKDDLVKLSKRHFAIAILLTMSSLPLTAQKLPKITFMEPDAIGKRDGLPVYHVITETARLGKFQMWLNNEAARMALTLFAKASSLASSEGIYYIAIVPEGNHAEVGFSIQGGNWVEPHPNISYIKLNPDEESFSTTFLHETGHVILAMMNGGKEIPKKEIASIPHSTAALTDRGTAFDEGLAIHLETTIAFLSSDPDIRNRYQHREFVFGAPKIKSEYHWPVADLLTYSQTRTRFHNILENSFAFAPAFRGADYTRVQLEKSRDFATLRDANQLLQSEGFYASFFFGLLVRGGTEVRADIITERQNKILDALSEMMKTKQLDADSPSLLYFVETYMQKFPSEAGEIVDVLMDLSHGVFVDHQAAGLWRDHYLGALRVDLSQQNNKAIEDARQRWRAEALKSPKNLFSMLGPQIRCEVPEKTIKLVAFEGSSPLSFDLNTVEYGIIKMIPEITDKEADSWILQRAQKTFGSADDFKSRSGVGKKALKHLRYGK